MAASELRVKDGGPLVKLRDPVHSALLDLVTIGVYGFFWYFYVNRELAALGRARGTAELGLKPGRSLLAVLPGVVLIVPTLVSLHNTVRRVQAARRLAGGEPAISASLATILLILPVGIWYLQRELNRVWLAEAEPSSGDRRAVPTAAPGAERQPS
jgi:hypothetical protein